MMLTRASRRSLRRNLLKQSQLALEATQLPFLYPAFLPPPRIPYRSLACNSASSKPAARTPRSHPPHHSISRSNPQHRRLASAAAAPVTYDYEQHQDEFIPFEGVPPGIRPLGSADSGHFSFFPLPGFAPDVSPLILKNTPITEAGKFRMKNAVSGNLNEIHQTLYACLQVGRLERAAVLVRRLNEIYKPDAPGLITAHNDYMREMTLRIVRTKDRGLLRDLHRWFMVDFKKEGIQPTAVTYALMIQASIHGSLEDTKAGRSVKHFTELASEAGLGDATMSLISEMEGESELALRYFQSPAEQSENVETTTVLEKRDDIPEIRPVIQKGLGLSTLKKSLTTLNGSDGAQDGRSDYMKSIDGGQHGLSPEERQRMLERNTLQAALDRWHEEDAHLKSMGISNILSTPSLGAIMWNWQEKLVPLIELELQKSIEAESKSRKSPADSERLLWAPYMQSVDPKKLSALTIISCIKSISLDVRDEQGTKVIAVIGSIGKAVQDEALYDNKQSSRKYRQWRAISQKASLAKGNQNGEGQQLSELATNKIDNPSFDQDVERAEWPMSARIKIGATLLSRLIDVARVVVSSPDPKTGIELQEEQPVFYHTYTFMAGKRVGVIRLNATMAEKMSKAPLSPSIAKTLPMLVPPRPWVGFREGAYLEKGMPVVRLDSDDVQAKRYAVTASRNGDMSQVFAGLDVLAQTPWKINRGVFDVMVEAWNSGEAIAKIPQENPAVEHPAEPLQDVPVVDRMKWIKKVKEIENFKGGVRSQRCFLNFQLEVARAYLNETFYFPHNVDFRGRAYPMAPFLNHMGADNARGLLRFAEERILGPSGLWWLKVHLANMFGYDKASLQERVNYAEEHLSDVIDSAEKGLHGNRWWLTAEDPWQALAACKELATALALPDPTRFRSSLAIHQDGTCNGLQHYAALGGDIAGAKQVNLEPGDRPSDIYTAVAEMVKKEISEEAAKGNEIAIHLNGKITRKVVKQTVMTNVYGVTFIGAKAQVRKQLDASSTQFPDTPVVNKDLAAAFIARKIFHSLSKMFNGAHDIQFWFGDCARRICSSVAPEQIIALQEEQKGSFRPTMFKSKLRQIKGGTKIDDASFNTGVIWTTPLKMPVVQSYSRRGISKIETNLQLITIQNPSFMDPVNKAKQLQAFPPNFIHSLDGTHMFLTALKCHELGLRFAAVHDSFWTHAGDVDAMSKITRDAFIRMHSENIVERLRAEFETRYKGHMQLAAVHRQSPVSKKILAWRKANGMKDLAGTDARLNLKELLLEARRQALLNSDEAPKRKAGEKMVTPASIYEQSEASERITSELSALDRPVALGRTTRRGIKLKANEKLKVGEPGNAQSVLESSGEITPITGEETGVDDEGVDAEDDDGEITAEATSNTLPGSSYDPLDASFIRAAEERKKKQSLEAARRNAKTHYWTPLTFPPVPEKVLLKLQFSLYF